MGWSELIHSQNNTYIHQAQKTRSNPNVKLKVVRPFAANRDLFPDQIVNDFTDMSVGFLQAKRSGAGYGLKGRFPDRYRPAMERSRSEQPYERL